MKMEEGFLDFFNSLDDPRSTRNRLYTISEILLCTLSAAICGAEGWQDIEDYNGPIDSSWFTLPNNKPNYQPKMIPLSKTQDLLPKPLRMLYREQML